MASDTCHPDCRMWPPPPFTFPSLTSEVTPYAWTKRWKARAHRSAPVTRPDRGQGGGPAPQPSHSSRAWSHLSSVAWCCCWAAGSTPDPPACTAGTRPGSTSPAGGSAPGSRAAPVAGRAPVPLSVCRPSAPQGSITGLCSSLGQQSRWRGALGAGAGPA